MNSTNPLNEISESIETRIVDVPLKKVHNHSSASHAHQSLVFLTLRTASGVVAYGEGGTPAGTAFWGGESSATIKCVIDRYLAPDLRGVNMLAHERVPQAMAKTADGNRLDKDWERGRWGKTWVRPVSTGGRR